MKKTHDDVFPLEADPLYRLLRLAIEQPGYRPAFYRELLNSRVLSLVYPGPVALSATGVPMLKFVEWKRKDGALMIPFFSSQARLLENPPSAENSVRLSVPQLFEMNQGADFHLNPNCEFGRSFTASEAESLLLIGVPGLPAQDNFSEDRSSGIRSTRVRPAEMLNSLVVYFSRQQEVQRAYFAERIDLDTGIPKSWFVGIEVQGEVLQTMTGAATIVQDHQWGDRPIDILPLGDGGFSAGSCGLVEGDCFYVRTSDSIFLD